MSTFTYLSQSEQADCEQSMKAAAPYAELFGEALKLSLPTGQFSPHRVADVASLCYYGKQLGPASSEAFVVLIKDGTAKRMASMRLSELLDAETMLRMNGVVSPRDESEYTIPPALLRPGRREVVQGYLEGKNDIPLLEQFLAAKTLKERLEAWSKYMGFPNYASVKDFYDRLDAFCAELRFGNYHKLCHSTAYFDQLLRMDSSIKGLFDGPVDLAFHRDTFGMAAPFWIDALVYCRRGGASYWIEAFSVDAATKSILVMERRDTTISIHPLRGLSYHAGFTPADPQRVWNLNPKHQLRIHEIARKRLGDGLIHYSDEFVLTGGVR
jgi:hypothetical protein